MSPQVLLTCTVGSDRQNRIAEASGRSSGHVLVAGLSDAPLYPGAQLSEYQSYLLISQYAAHHSLTTKVFTELLQLLSVHVLQVSAITVSVHSLKRSFVDAFLEAKANQHLLQLLPKPYTVSKSVLRKCMQ